MRNNRNRHEPINLGPKPISEQRSGLEGLYDRYKRELRVAAGAATVAVIAAMGGFNVGTDAGDIKHKSVEDLVTEDIFSGDITDRETIRAALPDTVVLITETVGGGDTPTMLAQDSKEAREDVDAGNGETVDLEELDLSYGGNRTLVDDFSDLTEGKFLQPGDTYIILRGKPDSPHENYIRPIALDRLGD